MVTVLRPLSTSELLDRTFHLYRNNFLVFVGITAIPQLLVLALQLGSAAMLFSGSVVGFSLGAIVAGLASFIAIEISQAATVMAVSHLHLDRPTTIGTAFSAAQGSLGRVIGISLAVGLAVVVGFFLLIIPGVYLGLAWSLAIPITVLEGGGLSASTRRSKALTKGSFGRIFVIYFLIVALTVIVSMVVAFVLLLPLGMMALHGSSNVAASNALQSVANFISTSLVGPLAIIAITLIYYDQRVRKEGFDLQLMMSNLEGGGPSDAGSLPIANTGT
jgi:hypothetical protein